jgi:hypothetical protein
MIFFLGEWGTAESKDRMRILDIWNVKKYENKY